MFPPALLRARKTAARRYWAPRGTAGQLHPVLEVAGPRLRDHPRRRRVGQPSAADTRPATSRPVRSRTRSAGWGSDKTTVRPRLSSGKTTSSGPCSTSRSWRVVEVVRLRASLRTSSRRRPWRIRVRAEAVEVAPPRATGRCCRRRSPPRDRATRLRPSTPSDTTEERPTAMKRAADHGAGDGRESVNTARIALLHHGSGTSAMPRRSLSRGRVSRARTAARWGRSAGRADQGIALDAHAFLETTVDPSLRCALTGV